MSTIDENRAMQKFANSMRDLVEGSSLPEVPNTSNQGQSIIKHLRTLPATGTEEQQRACEAVDLPKCMGERIKNGTPLEMAQDAGKLLKAIRSMGNPSDGTEPDQGWPMADPESTGVNLDTRDPMKKLEEAFKKSMGGHEIY